MARLSGLGKGLGALIPAESGGPAGEGPRLEDLPVANIQPNPHQPRVHFDEETLAELAMSIGEIGVLQPILVHPLGDGNYQLVAGERRWRAARRAGLQLIPAIVRTTDELGTVERALIENLHRADLTALEEAAAYQQLSEDFGLTHEQIATRVGKSRSSITNTLRLMSLPAAVQHLLADGRLSAGHARALLGSPDRARQEQLAKLASLENWSVRMVEEAVRGDNRPDDAPRDDLHEVVAHDVRGEMHGDAHGDGGRADGETADGRSSVGADRHAPPRVAALRPPGLLELEHLLSEHLSTRVAITAGAHRGRVSIEFADLADLERIYHLMTTPPAEPGVNEEFHD